MEYEVIPSAYEEDMTLDMWPIQMVRFLAQGKAKDVADIYPDALVIWADTFVTLRDIKLWKPTSVEDAYDILMNISGTIVEVHTGMCVIMNGICKTVHSVTKVYMKDISPVAARWYIWTWEPMDKAWAFAIQGIGSMFVARIEWDITSVIWLNLWSLIGILQWFGVDI